MELKYYSELTLLPGGDLSLYFLWEKLFARLHLLLVEALDEQGRGVVGCSFPEYDATAFQLGSKLRLFADSEEGLEALQLRRNLARMADYLHQTRVREVPAGHGEGSFFRIQTKSSTERLARRKAMREGVSYDDALQEIAGRKIEVSKAPFIRMQSYSSAKRYRLMIGFEKKNAASAGSFSSYGLSRSATVPLF